jgi:hypothetical protein
VESIDIKYFNKSFESAKESKPDLDTFLPQWARIWRSEDDHHLYGLSRCTAPSKSVARLAARARGVENLSYQIQTEVMMQSVEDSSEKLSFFSSVTQQKTENIISGITSFREETSGNGAVWLGLRIPKPITMRIEEEIEKQRREEDLRKAAEFFSGMPDESGKD